jgi:methylase of polypeptide subunit release factors
MLTAATDIKPRPPHRHRSLSRGINHFHSLSDQQLAPLAVTDGVYEPREDSQLLVDMMEMAGDDQTSSERSP